MTYAAVELDASDPTAIVFVLKIKRNSQSIIYKCFIPMIANAIVVMLTATMGNDRTMPASRCASRVVLDY